MKSSTPIKYKDGVDILVCKILVWEPADKNTIDFDDPAEDKCLIIRECVNIEIAESYKKLIGTATVRFPRGTVIGRTQTAEEIDKNGPTTVYTERLNDGTIIEKRAGGSVAQPKDFKVGQRIRIYLGYYHDEGKVFENATERRKEMEQKALGKTPHFDGYIVKCSVSTPIEIRCENLASGLKRKTLRNLITPDNITVNDLLKEGGKYELLKGTGLKLHSETSGAEITIGKEQLSDDLTVADLLTGWANKYHLYCYLKLDSDKLALKVGSSNFSTKTKESILNSDKNAKAKVLQFDYHVAEDHLTMMSVDPKFLAVEAQSLTKDGKFYRLAIRINPDWTGQNDTSNKKFQVINETQLSKKSMKLVGSIKDSTKKKVDLSQYTVIPYMSRKIGISKDDLQKEAEAYFEGYNMNGIEGSVTVFGDYFFQPCDKVELLDIRQPEKNGWYLIEEINTKFGVNGFRQTLKLPYCIAKAEKQ